MITIAFRFWCGKVIEMKDDLRPSGIIFCFIGRDFLFSMIREAFNNAFKFYRIKGNSFRKTYGRFLSNFGRSYKKNT